LLRELEAYSARAISACQTFKLEREKSFLKELRSVPKIFFWIYLFFGTKLCAFIKKNGDRQNSSQRMIVLLLLVG